MSIALGLSLGIPFVETWQSAAPPSKAGQAMGLLLALTYAA